MKKHYKYIHIMWHDETKFNGALVSYFHSNKNNFNQEEHLFFTPYKSVYEKLPHYDNVVYKEFENPRSAEVINTIGDKADWIICHNICERIELLKVRPKYIRKIIWRSWGGDRLQNIPYGNGLLKNIAKKFINYEAIRRVRCFKAIGIANLVDEIDLSNKLGEHRYFRIPYFSDEIDFNNLIHNDSENINECNILVGHSGFSEDKHIEILGQLLKYKDFGLKPYLVLSYGSVDYIKKVIQNVNENWGNNAIVITDFMNYSDYVKLLSNMDIGIFPAKYSYALGNIALMVSMNKKIFLDDNGIIAEAFRKNGTHYESVNNLSNYKYDDLLQKINYSEHDIVEFGKMTLEKANQSWKELFDFLDE